MIRIFVGYLCT